MTSTIYKSDFVIFPLKFESCSEIRYSLVISMDTYVKALDKVVLSNKTYWSDSLYLWFSSQLLQHCQNRSWL